MTLLGTIVSYFPAFVILSAGTSFFWLCFSPGIFSALAFFLSLYGLPLLAYRIHAHFYPIEEGISYLRSSEYSPWWGSHQIQCIYIAFPALETLLRLIPGVFSFWLRLWGAKIGRGIYWTPHLELADRGLIEVGDRVVFGYQVGIYSHVIKPKKDNLMLYVKRVKIGNNVFIGAGSRLAAGVEIKDDSYLPVMTEVFPNREVA
jgi:acetyltransferase-like isoleucine patch superfamily enzyme